MVVVLIPPAVEPGEPPTNIRHTISIWLLSVNWFKSMVLNPAVRGVTA